MKITWMGHASFILESDGCRVLLDPFQEVPGLRDVTAQVDAVYCSHGHYDHAYMEQVTLTGRADTPFTVKEIPAFHDDEGGAKRGENMIRSFTAEGITVVHLGDLGHQLSREQVEAIGTCDVLLIPVGGTYTLDPVQAKAVCDALATRIVIPMHYRRGDMGFPVLRTVEEFTSLFPRELVREYESSSFVVDRETEPQVAVPGRPA